MAWKNAGCPTIMFALHFLLYFWLIVFQNAEVLCFLKIQKICFMIDTRSSKIYSEIAETIEVKGAYHELFKTPKTCTIWMSKSKQNNENKVGTQL